MGGSEEVLQTICWILIGVLAFYAIRNLYVGNFLYPAAGYARDGLNEGLRKYAKYVKYINFKLPQGELDFRNYYLFVLNPFWWRVTDVFKDAEWRKLFRDAVKSSKSFK